MWQSNEIKDVLGLIVEKLNKKDALSMIWVCKYWRYVLKEKVSKRYMIKIKKPKSEPFALSWHTILCKSFPIGDFSASNIQKLIICPEISFLDFRTLPQGLETLIFRISEDFTTQGEIPSISNLCIIGKNFPYFLLTANTKKLTYAIRSTTLVPIDFHKLNVGRYTTLFLKPVMGINGNISLLTSSYTTLKKLALKIIQLNDLTCFEHLEELDVKSPVIDISFLPKSLKKLKISSANINNFNLLTHYRHIEEYHIDSIYTIDNIVYPPNVIKCNILNKSFTRAKTETQEIISLPQSLKVLIFFHNHLNDFLKIHQKCNINLDRLKIRVLENDVLNLLPFSRPIKCLEFSPKYEIKEDTFSNIMNITSLKIASDKVDLSFIPYDVKSLLVKKTCKVFGTSKNSSLMISKFNSTL